MITRRGMTMVELLVALALLAALMVAGVSWSTATTRAAAEYGNASAWSVSAERMLAWIDEMLVTENASVQQRRWQVRVADNTLAIRTRAVYSAGDTPDDPKVTMCPSVILDLDAGQLRARFIDMAGRTVGERPLLGDCVSMDLELTELDNHRVLLTVRLISQHGENVARSWRFRREDVG